MPPLPKRKFSSRRQGKKRATQGVKLLNLVPCPNCGQFKKPHRVCSNCGTYKLDKKNEVSK